MRLVAKTMEKVVIEVHTKEIENDGFDFVWDKVRNVYKIKDYEVYTIEQDKEKTLIFIELSSLKQKDC